MAVHTQNAWPNALNPLVQKYFKVSFAPDSDMVGEFFGTESSNRHQEIFSTLSGLGTMPVFGGTLQYLQATEGYTVTVTHRRFAAGLQIDRDLLMDDQSGEIKRLASGFGMTARKRRIRDVFRLLNEAFQVTSYFQNHEEGVALCSTAHTTPVSGVSTAAGFSNYSTAPLSRTALAADRYTMQRFRDYQGEFMDEQPSLLWVPVDLRDKAEEITRTPMGLDTAGMNYNTEGSGRWTVKSSVYLNSTTNWFTIAPRMMKENCFWIDREKMRNARMEDFDTYHAKYSATMRYSWFYVLWQFILGHQVS